jgi:protein involved in polysaccharide export with SLBB domain
VIPAPDFKRWASHSALILRSSSCAADDTAPMFMKQPLTLKVTFWQHLGGDMAGASPERSQSEALLIDVVGWLGRRMRLPRKFRFSGPVGAVALAALAGCSSLPDSGPSASDITAQQALSDQDQRYLVVDIAPATVEALRRRGYGSFSAEFGDRRVSSEPVIGVGDSVTVTIWEAASGGLFSAPVIADRVSTGSNSATIPEQVVGRDGGITVPYAGRVRVAGRTTRAVQDQIEHALEGKAIQPQVLVNVVKTAGDSVSVGGEVAAGARVPLSVKGDRVLDVLASAGGGCARRSTKRSSNCRAGRGPRAFRSSRSSTTRTRTSTCIPATT